MAVANTHEEIQELLGAYALHATDAEENAVVEAHLADCPWCRVEVRQHQEVAARLSGTAPAAPLGVWDRIVEQLEGEPPSRPAPRPLAGVDGPDRSRGDDRPAPPASGRSGLSPTARRWLVAAAVVVVLGVVGALLGVVANQQGRIDDLDQAVRSSTTAAAARTVSLTDDQQQAVGEVVIASDGTARFTSDWELGAPDAEHVYQLWGVTGDDLISLAVLDEDPTTTTFRVPPEVTTLAVTEEVSPGVVTSAETPLAAGPVV